MQRTDRKAREQTNKKDRDKKPVAVIFVHTLSLKRVVRVLKIVCNRQVFSVFLRRDERLSGLVYFFVDLLWESPKWLNIEALWIFFALCLWANVSAKQKCHPCPIFVGCEHQSFCLCFLPPFKMMVLPSLLFHFLHFSVSISGEVLQRTSCCVADLVQVLGLDWIGKSSRAVFAIYVVQVLSILEFVANEWIAAAIDLAAFFVCLKGCSTQNHAEIKYISLCNLARWVCLACFMALFFWVYLFVLFLWLYFFMLFFMLFVGLFILFSVLRSSGW